MSGWKLTLKQAPTLRVDLRMLSPAALAELAAEAVAKLRVWHGNESLALGELFTIATRTEGELLLEGDLAKMDRIGWQLAGGTVRIEGSVGDYLGAGMSGGEIVVSGNAGLLAACEMAGGRLEIAGNTGDHAASALPGSMDGMRGGTLVVRGHAGARFGDRMRRGTALVFGDVGDFLASRMVAGTIALGGRAGSHVGYGMRRGSVVFAAVAPAVDPCFVPLIADAPVFWQLLARDLARHGGRFEALPTRRIDRLAGDVSAGGKGELIFVL